MNKLKIELKKGFVKAVLWSVPIYYNEETDEVEGRNFLYGFVLDFVVFWQVEIMCVEGFPILITEEEEDGNG